MDTPQNTLRETLEANIEAAESASDQPETTTPETTEPEVVQEAAPEADTQGRTANRLRDEKGRLLPGKVQEQKPEPVQEAKPRPPRPSSWKKEYWDHWEKIDPTLAEYLNQRESEFAKGVSTYKTEWEKAKPFLDAIEPFKPTLERFNVNPTEHVQRLFTAHEKLALGTPQDKLTMFAQLARDYNVPLQGLFVQGQDGQLYLNQQLLAQAPQPAPRQEDHRSLVKQVLEEERMASEISAMESNKEQYPHFEDVRQDMARLLEAGLAQDLATAYQAALRLPQHASLYEANQELERQQNEQRLREQRQAQVQRAKASAVSPRSQTFTGTPNSGAKGLRAHLENAVEAFASSRV